MKDETQAKQISRLRLLSTFNAAHPTIQCYYHCAVYMIQELGTIAHPRLPYYALGWILNVVDGIPSKIEPQEAQYHGSLTTYQDKFVRADFMLDSQWTHRTTTDYVPGTTYAANQSTAQQYSTIEPQNPHMTYYRLVCSEMHPKPQTNGRIIYAAGRVCQLIMRPYSTDGWIDMRADAAHQDLMRIADQHQRRWTFNVDNLAREYSQELLKQLGTYSEADHTFTFGISKLDSEQRMISFSAPHQTAGKHPSVLRFHDQHTSDLQLMWMYQCPEGWREPPTDVAGSPGTIIRNHAARTVLDMSTFSNSQARLILRGREAAAHTLYNLVTAKTKFFLWTAHHLYVHAGYPLPKNLQPIASQEGWIQEQWDPSPAYVAFDSRIGEPELPLFAAPHAPSSVTWDLIPYMVDDHNPKEIRQQYHSQNGREISVNLITTLDTHHYLKARGGPLEALYLLYASSSTPPPFCAYFASSPPHLSV